MELTKKTTILFPPTLHQRLGQLARQQGVSMGKLVRQACEKCYGIASIDDRREAVRTLSALSLPVSDPAQMEAESVSDPGDLLP